MKKNKTKSLLACAVLASVLGAAAPVWADEVGVADSKRLQESFLCIMHWVPWVDDDRNNPLIGSAGVSAVPMVARISSFEEFAITGRLAGPIGRVLLESFSEILNPDGSTLILDNVGKIEVTAKSADSRAVLTMGNGSLTYLNFANEGGITMTIEDDKPDGQFNYYVAEGMDNSLTVLKNLQDVTINNTPVTVDANFWQCLETTGGAQIVVLDKDNKVVAADADHWGTESHGEDIGHFYRPIANETKDNVQSMTALGFDNSNVIALGASTADASATFGVLDGSLRSVNFGTGDACAVSATGDKTATLTDVSSVNVNASDGNANFISVSGGGNITVNGKDNWATVDVKSEKKDANFVFAENGTNTVNVNGVDAMLYPGADGKAYVAHVKAGTTTLNLKDSSVSGNLNTVLIAAPVQITSGLDTVENLRQILRELTVQAANGPTAIFFTGKSAQTALLGPIADDGCSYMIVLPFVYLPELTNQMVQTNDAAGLAISEKMRAQIRGLNKASANDFNLEIKDREFIVFVGPSGCGKSTTLRMVARLEDISGSEIRIRDFINPKDVETLEVLKDATATALYGSRGANSVPVYALLPMAYYTPAYVQAEKDAVLNLNLDNFLLMAGVNSFEEHGTVKMDMNNSNWVMQDDSNVKRLSMDDKSEVIFDRDSWKYLTLNVDEYQGNGNFILNADLGYSDVTSDKLVIKKALVQNAIGGSGDPVLNLYVLTDDNPLTDPNTKAEVLTLGEDAEDLQINLITDNIPDIGLWRYTPEWSKDENSNSTLSFGLKRGDELSTVGRAVTGGVIDTQVWYQESDAVFEHLDSTLNPDGSTLERNSVWASYTHSKNTYDNSIKAITSVANQGGIEKRYNGAVVGYDQCIATYPEHNAALYMGGLIGYGEGRNSWSGGNSELDGKGIGIYAGYKTYKGAYLTALAKYNQYDMDVKGYGYNEVKDDYRLHSFGVSVNAGRRYAKDLNKGFYIEPQAELGYVNYGNDNYELKGIKVEMQETKSCRGRLGLQFGTHNGRADVYGRVSYFKDFQGDSDIMTHYLNGTRDSIKVEQGGHWWNFALGGTFTNGKNMSADVSLNLDRGDHDSKLGFRVGLNWAF